MHNPIALICYNRPDHLARVLSALCARLSKSEQDSIYIFCDGPRDQKDAVNVGRVRSMVSGYPRLITRPRNIGLAASVTQAVDHVLRRHETVIVLEDDCVPGPYFVDYMDSCLDQFFDFDKVMAVGGYTLPLPQTFLSRYEHNVYFYPRIESWGWATWKSSWKLLEPNTAKVLGQCKSLGVDINQGGRDVLGMAEAVIGGSLDAWTPAWLLSTYLMGGLCVYPTESHIDNVGFDGSGQNCGNGDAARWNSQMADGFLPNFPHTFQVEDEINQVYRSQFG